MLSTKIARMSTVSIVVLLAACGSSDKLSIPVPPTTTTTTTTTTTASVVAGSIVKDNVSGATVTIKNAATGATFNAQAGLYASTCAPGAITINLK